MFISVLTLFIRYGSNTPPLAAVLPGRDDRLGRLTSNQRGRAGDPYLIRPNRPDLKRFRRRLIFLDSQRNVQILTPRLIHCVLQFLSSERGCPKSC